MINIFLINNIMEQLIIENQELKKKNKELLTRIKNLDLLLTKIVLKN